MKHLYLILVSICLILFGIASFCIVQCLHFSIFELFVLIAPIIGIIIAIFSLNQFFKQK